jgi:hypothetical protein
MKNLKTFENVTDTTNEKDYYSDPTEFETLTQIDVYLGSMRKKLIIDIQGTKAEFSSDEALELIDAITSAQSKM